MILQKGTVLSNRYEIIEKIGSGGMAIVYKTMDKKLERIVAVKVLREEFVADEEFISRFRVEAQAAARLNHPNIVNIYDVGQDESVYYIVMEYIDGYTLKDLIDEKGPFDTAQTLSIAVQIAQALSHAHKHQVVHRDIKPQNILAAKDGSIKVTDFGIARATTSSTVSMTSSAIGSVYYFSPEQARGGYIDDKSDIYSLGVAMYEMSAAKLPFTGDSSVAIAMKHLNDKVPAVRNINDKISVSVERIIMKAMKKNPKERYSSIDEMSMDLKKAFINPSGDFIKTIDMVDSPTIKMSEQEMNIIKESEKSNYDDNEYELFFPRKKAGEEPADQDEETTEGAEKKVIIAAILTALAIISVISFIGIRMINRNKPVMIEVPNFVGLTTTEANQLAREKNITLRKNEERYDDIIEEGRILSQNVDEGEEIPEGGDIIVDVSKGSNKIIVPSMELTELSQAQAYLESHGLKVKVRYEYSDTIPKDVVKSQNIDPDSVVVAGGEITLTVSMGQEVKAVFVPNVEGETEAVAKAKLEAARLVVGQITNMESATVEKGRVIKQTEEAGKELPQNSVVGLVISLGKPTEASGTNGSNGESNASAGSQQFTINPINIPEGAEEVKVKIIRITSTSSTEFYVKTHKVSEFPLDIPVTGKGTVEFQFYIETDTGSILQYEEVFNFDE